MTTDDVDRRLRKLSREVQDSADALLALELDPTRELMEKSQLAGATASAWATVSAELGRAWEAQALLEEHLARVRQLRGGRSQVGREQLLELEDLLDGPTVATGDLGARSSSREVLTRASATISDARQLISTVARTWDALVPRLTTANATLRACADLLDELGAPPSADVTDARAELGRLTDAIAKDPISAGPEPVAALEAAVAAVRGRVERLRDFRADAEGRLDEARALLAEARHAGEDAREAHRAALVKIAAADVPSPVALPADLATELDDVVTLARSTEWHDAGEALERWRARTARARDEARRVAAANRAPIALRDELRGRLGAYQAKAQRLRLLEDAPLAALHARAHRILHTAPTDLAEAADLVRRYQEGLSNGPERKVLR
jgi:chromosome segregation ATPase